MWESVGKWWAFVVHVCVLWKAPLRGAGGACGKGGAGGACGKGERVKMRVNVVKMRVNVVHVGKSGEKAREFP